MSCTGIVQRSATGLKRRPPIIVTPLGQLVNYMGHRAPHNELVSSMNPARLWRSVETSQPRDGYAWGHFLGRLAYAGSSKWRARATQALDRGAIKDLVGRFTARDLDHLAEFIQGMASFDLDFGLECVRTALPSLQSGFGAKRVQGISCHAGPSICSTWPRDLR